MILFIQVDWYGMFIISIPVYAFLVILSLIALGGKQAEGTVFSIDALAATALASVGENLGKETDHG